MSKMWVNGIALVLLIASLPLISIGATQDNPALWWAGLGLLVVAGAAIPVSRYAFSDDADEDDDEDSEQDKASADDESEQDEDEGRSDDEGEHRDAGDERPQQGTDDPAELRARAHEERAAAHRERARVHEELAAADEEQAHAQERRTDDTKEEEESR